MPPPATPTAGKSAAAEAIQAALRDVVIGALRDNRDVIVEKINERINIPLIGEGTEGRLYGAVLDAAIEAAAEVL